MTANHKISTFAHNIGLYIAFFCIGLGLISIISSNWQEIPDIIKLAADFILLSGAAYCTYWGWSYNKAVVRESAVIFNAILIMASIGLIIQVYQLQIEPYYIILIWSFLTLPLIALTRKKILALVWIPLFIYAVSVFFIHHPIFHFLFRYLSISPIAVLIFINTIFVLIYLILKFWTAPKLPEFVLAYKFWLIVNFTFMVLQLDFLQRETFFYEIYYQLSNYHSLPDLPFYFQPYLITAVAIALIYGLSWKLRAGCLFTNILAISWIYGFFVPEGSLYGMLYTLAVLLVIGISGYKKGYIRQINTAGILAAIRIFIGYIQVFGTLLMTGIGLVASGILILIFIYGIKFLNRVTKSSIQEQSHEQK